MGKNKQTYFQESWLSDPKCSHWGKGRNSKLIIDVNFAKKKINLVQAVLMYSKLLMSCSQCRKIVRECSIQSEKAEEKSGHLEILKKGKEELISEIKKSFPNNTVFLIQEINRLLIRRHILTSN